MKLAAVGCALAGSTAAPALAQQTVTVTVTLHVTATATVDTAKVQAQTKTAIRGLMAERARVITSGGPDTTRMHDRLRGGALAGDGEPAAGFAEDDKSKPATNARMSRQHAATDGTGGPVGTGGASILDGEPGPMSRFSRGSQRGGMLPYGRDEPSDFGPRFGPGGDMTTEQAPGRGAPLPFRFSGNSEDGTGRFAFAASLSQMRAAAEARERERLGQQGIAGVGAATEGETPQTRPSALGVSPTTPVSRGGGKPDVVDVWVEGRAAYFTNDRIDGRRQGHASIIYAGTDVLLMPWLLVGIMGQADWIADSSTATTASSSLARDGRGWMIGPYVSARLSPNLFFDARAAWGRSTNNVEAIAGIVDAFEATRMLASAKLTGDYSWGAVRVRPVAEVIWFSETSDAFTNTIGIAIDKVSYNLGRFTFGPEIGTRIPLGRAGLLEPFVGLKGVWDFARTTETTIDGTPVGSDSVTGRVEAGAVWRAPNGISLRASGQYDGLGGSGYHAVQGKAQISIPLQ